MKREKRGKDELSEKCSCSVQMATGFLQMTDATNFPSRRNGGEEYSKKKRRRRVESYSTCKGATLQCWKVINFAKPKGGGTRIPKVDE